LFATPREKRLLKTIERETKQTILPFEPPSSEDITKQRVEEFKESIGDAIGSQDLEFFQQLAWDYAAEHSMELSEVAGALVYLAQKEQPLLVNAQPLPGYNQDRGRDRNDRGESRGRRDREERGGKRRAPDVALESFRLEVGREHGATPRDIVGAIANEANIDSQYIGNIKLHQAFSVVELPADMPKEVEQHLKGVVIRNKKIDLKRDPRASGDSRPRGGKRNDRGGNRDDRGNRGGNRDGGRRDDRGGSRRRSNRD
jgi:ATP-dependent RNA helicase DeaD